MNNTYKRKVGRVIIFSSLFIWIVDKMTQIFTDILGKILYGHDYPQPVDGLVGDMSYGFRTNMHLAFSLIVLFIVGIVLYISSHDQDKTSSSEEL